MAALERFEVAFEFIRQNRKTGEETLYVPGSDVPPDLTPTDIEEYLDGTKFGQQGPLIRKKPNSTRSALSAEPSNKEK